MGDFERVERERVKDKLFNMEKDIGNYDGLLDELGKFLYNRMKTTVSSIGFLITFHTSIVDLRRGIDSRTGFKINSKLIGLSVSSYNIMIHLIPRIAEVVFEEKFCNQIKGFHHDILEEMNKNGSLSTNLEVFS